MASARPRESERTRLDLRPPRLLLADGEHAGCSHEPEDVPALLRSGAMTRVTSPAVVVYQILEAGHQQTGVVVEVSIDDYRARRVRPHEATDPEREQRVLDHLTEVRFQNTPVMLTHSPRSGLRDVLSAVTASEPDIVLAPPDGPSHHAWVVRDAEVLSVVSWELAALDTLYITDGHHRMAAADRFAALHPGGSPDRIEAFTLGALFPSDEMRVLGYPRSVVRPNGWTSDEVITVLLRSPAVARVDAWHRNETPPRHPGSVALALDGQWYRLWLRAGSDELLAGLDSVRLDREVLLPLFGADAVTYVRGDSETETLTALLSDRERIGLLPYPATMADVVAVSDAAMVMPPKSTWFDPKACHGLFTRQLDDQHV